jgi:uncharacterized membrane protein required for colicin V production
MGLDLALGLIILIGAIRGWLKGFLSQVVRIGGFIACFYLADPVREQARPYVVAKLPAIEPGLMDRILWWVAAVVSYIVLVGLTTLAIQMMRTPPAPKMARSSRNDQFAGLLLGAAKALLVAAFLAAGIETYRAELVRYTPWTPPQASGSLALKWTEQYQPVPRIWATPAVRAFVEHIRRNGLKGPAGTEIDAEDEAQPAGNVAERAPAEAPSRPPRLELAPAETQPDPADLDPALAKELEDIKADLRARGKMPEWR